MRFHAALERAIAQDDGQKLRLVAEKLLDLAVAGEPFAMQMLADRLDGKPAQSVTLGSDPDNPFVARIESLIVDPAQKSGSDE